MSDGPYTVTDNSGSFTGRGWRVGGPDGFSVLHDHQQRLAEEYCREKNSAHKAACKAIAKMLTAQANHIRMLNHSGVPQSFIDKHNIEISILEHAAKVVLRDDLGWNAQALDDMNDFVSRGTQP